MMVIVENCTAFMEFATKLYKGIRLIPILNQKKHLQEKFGFLDSLAHERK
jgi:hypothetical protein